MDDIGVLQMMLIVALMLLVMSIVYYMTDDAAKEMSIWQYFKYCLKDCKDHHWFQVEDQKHFLFVTSMHLVVLIWLIIILNLVKLWVL